MHENIFAALRIPGEELQQLVRHRNRKRLIEEDWKDSLRLSPSPLPKLGSPAHRPSPQRRRVKGVPHFTTDRGAGLPQPKTSSHGPRSPAYLSPRPTPMGPGPRPTSEPDQPLQTQTPDQLTWTYAPDLPQHQDSPYGPSHEASSHTRLSAWPSARLAPTESTSRLAPRPQDTDWLL